MERGTVEGGGEVRGRESRGRGQGREGGGFQMAV